MANKTIELMEIAPKTAIITITGDGSIVCNKMNAVSVRNLTAERKGKAKNVTDKPNLWEEIITSIHWAYGLPTTDPNTWTEATMAEMLKTNKPCISAFGLHKSLCNAVTRFNIATYSTGFGAAVNIEAVNNLIPFDFSEHDVYDMLMSPKRGAPVLCHLNRFNGWSATFTIRYIDTVYSLEQIINIINYAGFGIGIGSGRSSGYGRYHVAKVVEVKEN